MTEWNNRSLHSINYLVLLGASLTPCVLYSLSLLFVFFGADYISQFSTFRLEGFTIRFLSGSTLCVAAFCLFYLVVFENLNWFEKLLHVLLWPIVSVLMIGFSILITVAFIFVIDGFPVPG